MGLWRHGNNPAGSLFLGSLPHRSWQALQWGQVLCGIWEAEPGSALGQHLLGSPLSWEPTSSSTSSCFLQLRFSLRSFSRLDLSDTSLSGLNASVSIPDFMLFRCLDLDNLTVKWNDRTYSKIQEGIHFPITNGNMPEGGCNSWQSCHQAVLPQAWSTVLWVPLFTVTVDNWPSQRAVARASLSVQQWPQPGLTGLSLKLALSSFTTLSGPLRDWAVTAVSQLQPVTPLVSVQGSSLFSGSFLVFEASDLIFQFCGFQITLSFFLLIN